MNLIRITYDRDGAETSRESHPNVDGTKIADLFEFDDLVAVTFDRGHDGTIRWERM